jgi:hypothetical protein
MEYEIVQKWGEILYGGGGGGGGGPFAYPGVTLHRLFLDLCD